jgi:ankyrin repeat protein
MIPPHPSSSNMPTLFSAVELVQRVRALGPEYLLYSTALDEKKTFDSAFLHNLTEREMGILFAFVPQTHQMKLEVLWSQDFNALENAPVERAVTTLELNSHGADEIVPDVASPQAAQGGDRSKVEVDGSSSSDELFLDLDGSSEDDEIPLPNAAGKKKKKRKNRKKKKAGSLPVDKHKQQDLDAIAQLDTWLSKGAPLTRKAALRTDLLIVAARVGHVEATRVLLGKPGIRVLLELPLGKGNAMTSALHVAAYNGHSDIVRLLLAKPDIQINRTLADGFTALLCASQEGHSEVVRILLDAGAEESPLMLLLASSRGDSDVVKVLLDAGVDIETKMPEDGCTSLFLAALNGHSKLLKALLSAGADKEARDSCLNTPLCAAALKGHAEVVSILLNAGADKEARSIKGHTSLFIAVHHGQSEVVKILLDAGADKEATTPADGMTALINAAHMGHSEVVQILLDAGADKTARTLDKRSSLIVATCKGHSRVVKILLSAGADQIARGEALGCAHKLRQFEVVRVLLDASPDIQKETIFGPF